MFGSKKKGQSTNELEVEVNKEKEQKSVFKKDEKTLKHLIAPGGIDASYTNHIEIAANRTRYARSMVVARHVYIWRY